MGGGNPAFKILVKCQASTSVFNLVEVVVVARGRLLGARPQGLQLGIQDVQQLLDEPNGGADVSRLDGTPREVDQLPGDVGRVLAALYLRERTH